MLLRLSSAARIVHVNFRSVSIKAAANIAPQQLPGGHSPATATAAVGSSLIETPAAPLPLANRREQQDFEELVRSAENDDSLQTHQDAEKEPLPAFPNDINPETKERNGPRGPEPTRFGDWERKGRVTDF